MSEDIYTVRDVCKNGCALTIRELVGNHNDQEKASKQTNKHPNKQTNIPTNKQANKQQTQHRVAVK